MEGSTWQYRKQSEPQESSSGDGWFMGDSRSVKAWVPGARARHIAWARRAEQGLWGWWSSPIVRKMKSWFSAEWVLGTTAFDQRAWGGGVVSCRGGHRIGCSAGDSFSGEFGQTASAFSQRVWRRGFGESQGGRSVNVGFREKVLAIIDKVLWAQQPHNESTAFRFLTAALSSGWRSCFSEDFHRCASTTIRRKKCCLNAKVRRIFVFRSENRSPDFAIFFPWTVSKNNIKSIIMKGVCLHGL